MQDEHDLDSMSKEELIRELKRLRAEARRAQDEGQYVGVVNVSEAEVWVRPLGGKPDGSEDILFPPYGKRGYAKPIAFGTWKQMVLHQDPAVKDGELVRDDSILEEFGGFPKGPDLREKTLFPNAVTPGELDALLRKGRREFKERIAKITSMAVLRRIRREANRAGKHDLATIVAQRIAALSGVMPENFDALPKEELLRIAAECRIKVDPDLPEADLRAFLRPRLQELQKTIEREAVEG